MKLSGYESKKRTGLSVGFRMVYLTFFGAIVPWMASASDLNVFSAGEIVSSSAMNENFSVLELDLEDQAQQSLLLNDRLSIFEFAMSIDSSQRVGIGTSTPTEQLEVAGNVKAASFFGDGSGLTGIIGTTQWSNITGGINYASGNVGIGTSTPGSLLHVNGDLELGENGLKMSGVSDSLFLVANTTENGVGIRGNGNMAFVVDSNDNQSDNSAGFYFHTGGGSSPLMKIEEDGNVGIGTSSPTQKLEVSGTVKATAFVGDGSGLTGIVGTTQWSNVTGGINYGSGYVGIGTTTPVNALDVQGNRARFNNILVGEKSGTSWDLIQSQNPLRLVSNGTYVSIETSGGEALRATSTGKIGIGTTSPVAALDVASLGGIRTAGDVGLTVVAASNSGRIHFTNSGTSHTWQVGTSGGIGADDWGISDYWAGIQVLTIKSSTANVGIGTTAPSQKLEVNGTVKATAFVGDGSGLTGITGTTQWSNVTGGISYSGGYVGIGTTAPVRKFEVVESANSNSANIVNSNASFTNTALKVGTTKASGSDFYMFSTAVGTDGDGVGGAVNFLIRGDGNVGIGTTSPSVKLHVGGQGRFDASLLFNDENGNDGTKWGLYGWDNTYVFSKRNSDFSWNSSLMVIQDTGNIGIGTTTPSEKLNLFGTNIKPVIGQILPHTPLYSSFDSQTNTVLEIAGTAAGGTGIPMISLTTDNNTTTTPYLGSISFSSRTTTGSEKRGVLISSIMEADSTSAMNGALLLFTASAGTVAERLRINSAGNVGIGTASPTQKLDVSGTVKATAFVGDGSGITGISGLSQWSNVTGGINYASGVVGVGTSSPAQPIHVSAADAVLRLTATASGGTSWDVHSRQVDGSFRITPSPFTTPAIAVLSTGNVGIGTTAPANTLDVQGNRARFNNILVGEKSGSSWDLIQSTNPLRVTSSGTYVTLEASGVETLRATSAGTVGIGTTAPTSALEISKTNSGAELRLTRSNNVSAASEMGTVVYRAPNASGTMLSWAQQRVVVENATAGTEQASFAINTQQNGALGEKFRVTSAGNIGIGTTAPGDKMELVGDSADFAIRQTSGNYSARMGSDSAGRGFLLLMNNTASASTYSVLFDSNGDSFINSGNVGIGTTAPTQKLDVAGTVKATAFVGDGSGITGISGLTQWTTSGSDIYFTTGNVGIGKAPSGGVKLDVLGSPVLDGAARHVAYVMDDTAVAAGVGAGLTLMGRTNGSGGRAGFATIQGYKENGTSGDYAGAMGLLTLPNGGSPVERLRITSTGNVGIGTTSPGYRFEVNTGTISNSYNGIKLSDGTVFGYNLLLNNSNVWGATTTGMAIGTGTSHPLIVATNGTERLRVDSSGNIGIGTASPSFKLDVDSSLRLKAAAGSSRIEMRGGSDGGSSSSIYIYNPSNLLNTVLSDGTYNSYLNLYGGYVGVGTANPTAPLDVIGSSRVLNLTNYANDTGGANISARKARGTEAAPSQALAGDRLFGVYGNGYTSGGAFSGNVGAIQIVAAENYTSTAQGTSINLDTTPLGATSRSTRMYISPSGYVSIGGTSPTSLLDVEGVVTADSYDSPSDRRLKTDIAPLENSMEGIECLEGVSYRWIDPNSPQETQIGLIAQDVERCFPEIVHTSADGMLSLDYSRLVAPLIENAKDQHRLLNWQSNRLRQQEQEIARLKAEQTGMNARLAKLEAQGSSRR